ncbi:L,D-transpeptidase family protein [Altererythrobacter soli]|uniref:L,D-transpeptidase family protein n=1 Tax=Croceibacterium soli TaxID=1739690 RepID=A0A6I4UWM1_9SPHN|nr:L,D-transpeptidase family protein [Croceibacterium soli]MXP41817.1 L,D-transpeptidase family protein [Croceibacterium soli]
MEAGLKWIGGATAAVLVLLASAVVGSNALEAQESRPDTWLTAEDVLVADDRVVAPEEPAIENVAMVQPLPTPAAAESPFVIKRILPIEGPIRYGEWHWDEEGVPDGPLVMTVDLEARVLSVFRGGYEIGATAVLLGTDDYPTPLGVFPILSKERHNISEKYGNAPMPWTLRLTWDGVAIHGGSQVRNGWASHGCIGAPDGFVSKLFAAARKGDKVIITRGRMAGLGDALMS